jgi:KaiC/GvpD/RAD55 family RecA-like ATPase
VDGSSYPYAQVLRALLRSTMLAQRELVLAFRARVSLENRDLNKYFSWLPLVVAPGRNRHLFEPAGGQKPLRTAQLRKRRKDSGGNVIRMAATVRERLLTFASVGHELTKDELTVARDYAQPGPTRISQLIRSAFAESARLHHQALHDDHLSAHEFQLLSPLSVLYEYLTIPAMPGTAAYALVALRNLLYEDFEIVPDTGAPPDRIVDSRLVEVLGVSDVEDSLSHIRTSLRRRYHSRGQDKLPVSTKADAFVRQFLALKGLLYLRFPDVTACADYLAKGSIRPDKQLINDEQRYPFEFSKSPHLARLPDVGELANELLGLPVPIRGADTIFRGGLRFSARQGLVVAVHGGPGTGKTALALALCAYLAPFGIQAVFLTAEENERDLRNRVPGLVSDDIRRLNFFPKDLAQAIDFNRLELTRSHEDEDAIATLERQLEPLAAALRRRAPLPTTFTIPKPCRAIVVLDGLHDLFAATASAPPEGSQRRQIRRLYQLIDALRELQALVIVTTGHEWAGDTTIDYLVDVAITLTHESVAEYGSKPDRRLVLSKARHQLCAVGTHGLHITGLNGLRFSPQINYQLDRRAVWKTRLPDATIVKPILRRVTTGAAFKDMGDQASSAPRHARFFDSRHSVDVFAGSHIFLNGEGSSGKAALALKMAMAPSFNNQGQLLTRAERVLIVSFLYPEEYYLNIATRLAGLLKMEYSSPKNVTRIEVIQLYPGHLRPNDLFNRIDWELQAADLRADPYTCVVIDGIHNVFLQFPAIESYRLFWPQLYNSLRSRPLTTITTHTTFSLPHISAPNLRLNDDRFEPLRHTLVQKTDFQFEIDPYVADNTSADSGGGPNASDRSDLSDLFMIKVLSAINQAIPKGHVLWSRDQLVLIEDPTLADRASAQLDRSL